KIQDDPFTRRAMAASEPVVSERHDEEEPLLVIAVPVVSGLRWGTLKAGFTLVPLEHRLERLRNRGIMVSVAISLGVAAVIYLMLSVLVIRPVMRMVGMTRAFGGGDLEARIKLENDDELGLLAAQLNSMAQQIQDHTNSLEQLVQERTSELAATNSKLLDANRQLDRLAKTDPLTGLYNRRHFMEQLEFEIRRGARTQRQFSLVFMDVDHFKNYNDSNGHTAGDELLQRLATLLELNLRSVDLVARYGGEEFVVLLLDTGPEEGHATSLKLQQVVAAQSFPLEESQPGGKLTVSVGVAFYPGDSRNARTLIEYADQALYRSKAAGRDRVTRWTDFNSRGT
ncbi:MAG: diguanylate cyclase, partial [Myxococcota bacterium]